MGQGNTEEAIELLRRAAHDAVLEALPILARLGDRLQVVWGLAMLARILAARGHEEAGGVCWGALEAEENRGPIGQWEAARPEYEQELAPYEGAAFERGRARGRLLSADEAVRRCIRALRELRSRLQP